MENKGMKCVDAVRVLIKRWPVGVEKTGGKIERETRSILISVESNEYPSGNTIMRRFRENKPVDIKSSMHGRNSKYVREERNNSIINT